MGIACVLKRLKQAAYSFKLGILVWRQVLEVSATYTESSITLGASSQVVVSVFARRTRAHRQLYTFKNHRAWPAFCTYMLTGKVGGAGGCP